MADNTNSRNLSSHRHACHWMSGEMTNFFEPLVHDLCIGGWRIHDTPLRILRYEFIFLARFSFALGTPISRPYCSDSTSRSGAWTEFVHLLTGDFLFLAHPNQVCNCNGLGQTWVTRDEAAHSRPCYMEGISHLSVL